MTRVVAAMNEAASTTTKISRVMKQAEDESAALFRLDGESAGVPAGGNGPAGGAEAGAVSAVGPSGPLGVGGRSRGSPVVTPAKTEPVAPKNEYGSDGNYQSYKAYDQYLWDYGEYRREQMKSWGWTELQERARVLRAEAERLARRYDTEVGPFELELERQMASGARSDLNFYKDLIRRRHEWNNQKMKLEREFEVIVDRANEIRDAAYKKAQVGGITAAEQQELQRNTDSYLDVLMQSDRSRTATWGTLRQWREAGEKLREGIRTSKGISPR
jgi:hypothetical protein